MCPTQTVQTMTRREANAEGGFNYYQSVNVSPANAEPKDPIRVVFPTPEDGQQSWCWDSTKPEPNRAIALVLPGDEYCGYFNGVDAWWVSNGTTTGYFRSGGMAGPPGPGLDTLTLTVFAV